MTSTQKPSEVLARTFVIIVCLLGVLGAMVALGTGSAQASTSTSTPSTRTCTSHSVTTTYANGYNTVSTRDCVLVRGGHSHSETTTVATKTSAGTTKASGTTTDTYSVSAKGKHTHTHTERSCVQHPGQARVCRSTRASSEG